MLPSPMPEDMIVKIMKEFESLLRSGRIIDISMHRPAVRDYASEKIGTLFKHYKPGNSVYMTIHLKPEPDFKPTEADIKKAASEQTLTPRT